MQIIHQSGDVLRQVLAARACITQRFEQRRQIGPSKRFVERPAPALEHLLQRLHCNRFGTRAATRAIGATPFKERVQALNARLQDSFLCRA
eukprot:8578180-Pyramimonas_sp.AAC.1